MKQGAQRVLAAVGGLAALSGAAHFGFIETSCPAPWLELLEMGLLGVGALLLLARKDAGGTSRRQAAGWAVCGALAALVPIGVWSFAPWAVLAVAGSGAALILGEWPFTRRTLIRLGVFFLAATANFLLLFPVAKHASIEVVDLPVGSLVTQAFARVDYADAYRAPLPLGAPQDVDSVTRAVLASLVPCWRSRDIHERVEARIRELTLQPGTPAFAKVYDRSENEILMGADEYHLNFRLSILVSKEGGTGWLTVSTIVQYNNWLGVTYFIPVRVGHQIIVPHVVRAAVHRLQE